MECKLDLQSYGGLEQGQITSGTERHNSRFEGQQDEK
jgi:hypothetical protein